MPSPAVQNVQIHDTIQSEVMGTFGSYTAPVQLMQYGGYGTTLKEWFQ